MLFMERFILKTKKQVFMSELDEICLREGLGIIAEGKVEKSSVARIIDNESVCTLFRLNDSNYWVNASLPIYAGSHVKIYSLAENEFGNDAEVEVMDINNGGLKLHYGKILYGAG